MHVKWNTETLCYNVTRKDQWGWKYVGARERKGLKNIHNQMSQSRHKELQICQRQVKAILYVRHEFNG